MMWSHHKAESALLHLNEYCLPNRKTIFFSHAKIWYRFQEQSSCHKELLVGTEVKKQNFPIKDQLLPFFHFGKAHLHLRMWDRPIVGGSFSWEREINRLEGVDWGGGNLMDNSKNGPLILTLMVLGFYFEMQIVPPFLLLLDSNISLALLVAEHQLQMNFWRESFLYINIRVLLHHHFLALEMLRAGIHSK